MTVAGTGRVCLIRPLSESRPMGRIVIVPILLVLAGCGGSSNPDLQYDSEQAKSCIRVAQPAETFVAPTLEAHGVDTIVFGEDRYAYEGYVLLVAYGTDHAAARKARDRAREPLKEAFRSHPVFGSDEGNVVYEAFGPSTSVGDVKVLPQGLTVDTVRRRSEMSAKAMEAELEKCLAAARKP